VIRIFVALGLHDEAAHDDEDHCNQDVPGKEACSVVVDDVEVTIAAVPSNPLLDNLPDAIRHEAPLRCTAGQNRDVDVVLERCRGQRRALGADVAD
jgi:hypothetical protein